MTCGKRLKDMKLSVLECFGNETDFVTKTKVIGSFYLRVFLNLAMVITALKVLVVTHICEIKQ